MGRQTDRIADHLRACGIECNTGSNVSCKYDRVSWKRHEKIFGECEFFWADERSDVELGAVMLTSFAECDECSYSMLMTLDEVLALIDEQASDSKAI